MNTCECSDQLATSQFSAVEIHAPARLASVMNLLPMGAFSGWDRLAGAALTASWHSHWCAPSHLRGLSILILITPVVWHVQADLLYFSAM